MRSEAVCLFHGPIQNHSFQLDNSQQPSLKIHLQKFVEHLDKFDLWKQVQCTDGVQKNNSLANSVNLDSHIIISYCGGERLKPILGTYSMYMGLYWLVLFCIACAL